LLRKKMKHVPDLFCLFIVLGFSSSALAVNIETVTVGNPNNTDDTYGNGYGGVDYTYNIGKFEVTADQYTDFLNSVASTDTYGLYNTNMWSHEKGCKIQRSGTSGSYSYSVASDWANRPVNMVSWGDAVRFANWLHNGQLTGVQDLSTTEDGSYYISGATSNTDLLSLTRETDATWVVPTEDEWHKAAYHKNDGPTGNYWYYPTGTDSIPSNDLINPDPGNNATFWQNGYTIGDPYYRTEVGEFENSESSYDTFDQGGNVWEWTEAIGSFSSCRVIRGWSWVCNVISTREAAWWQYPPTTEYSNIGFRIAQVPEPSVAVNIDIKPTSCPNPLNVKSKGVLPVAILGSEDFDVTNIDVLSVRLAGIAAIRSNYEDVATPLADANECECIVEEPDSFLDITLKFKIQEIVEVIGEVNHGDVLTLPLTGVLLDERPIEGVDCVLIRGKYKPFNRADINKDGVVDLRDFAIFTENWLQSSIVED